MDKQYTPEQLASMHKAFKAAKKYLNTGVPNDKTHSFICLAIFIARDREGINHYDAVLATKHIGKCIGPSSPTVSSWLWNNVPEIRTMKDASFCHQQIQAYRHRWLDHLIEQTKPKTAN